MSISSLRREISKCEAEIRDNNLEIRKLEDRNDELKKIEAKFSETGRKLYDYSNKRRRSYEELRYELRDTRFAVQNADDMLEYIDGSYCKRANEGVALGISKTKKVFRKNEDKIEELKRRNTCLRNRISELHEEIKREEERERERRRKKAATA